MSRAEGTIISDFDKAFRKNMLKEPANEKESGKSGAFGLSGVRIVVLESDLIVLDVEDAFIGKGDAIGIIRSEVFKGMFAVTDLFGVNDPIFIPNLFRELVKERGFLELVSELNRLAPKIS
jgi:hypothetical protein